LPKIIIMIKSRRMRWSGHAAQMGEKRNAYRTLMGRPDGKRPLVRHKCRSVDSIKMELREIGWGGVDWIHLDEDRGSCKYGNELPIP
jgi:hypothetical protein